MGMIGDLRISLWLEAAIAAYLHQRGFSTRCLRVSERIENMQL